MSNELLGGWLTNLGAYNEGRLQCEYIVFPTTTEEVQKACRAIGLDGKRYEEYFFSDYESSIQGLTRNFGEYENLDELNYLATVLDDLSVSELELFEAALDLDDHSGGVADKINLAQNLDNYTLYGNVMDADDVGRMYADEFECLQIPEQVKQYFDYEAYGNDIMMDYTCALTDYGYLVDTEQNFIEYFYDREDIPEECQVFAFPERKQPVKTEQKNKGLPPHEK